MKEYNKSLTNLASLQSDQIKRFVDSFDTVLADCDGVLWLANDPIKGSPEVMNTLRKLGKKTFFISNNSTKIKEEFEVKAKKLGYDCTIDDMMSTSNLAASYLKERNVKRAYVVGTTGITKELDKVGIKHSGLGPDVVETDLNTHVNNFVPEEDVGAVVVGFDAHISYLKLMKAMYYLRNPNCLFVATNTDEGFPVGKEFLIPGAGTFVSAIATCSGRTPTIMGKPYQFLKDALVKEHKIDPQRTLMIGDRCNTDILFGSNCGFQTLLVLTGVTKLEDAVELKSSGQKCLVADFYLEKLGDLLPYLQPKSSSNTK